MNYLMSQKLIVKKKKVNIVKLVDKASSIKTSDLLVMIMSW